MKRLFLNLLLIIAFTYCRSQEYYFFDDFNNNTNKWLESKTETGVSIISNGVYTLKHLRKEGSYAVWNYIFINPSNDFYIETKIRQIEGVVDNGFGVMWGRTGWSNYHQFLISTNGYYRITQTYNDKTTSLISKDWIKTDLVKPLGEYNKLAVEKKEGKYYFYLNDSKIEEINFTPFYGTFTGFRLVQNMTVEIDYLKLHHPDVDFRVIENAAQGFIKENLGQMVNSEYEELLPVISIDSKTLYFVRDAHPGNIGKEDQDIWISTLQPDNTWSKAINPGFPLNNAGANAVIAVSPDGNTLTLSNSYNPDGTPKGGGISFSKKTTEGWSIPQEIIIKNFYNSAKYVSYNLCPDGKTLLMSIQRKDSKGDRDIYVSFLDDDNEWSEPLNLGPDVNTFAADFAPFMAADNITLYYCTTGHPGYGDVDIFMTRRLDNTWINWSIPENLGPEINTPNWDAYYTIPASGTEAFIVSNNSKNNSSDIFKIKMPESAKPKPVILIYGKTLNSKTSEPITANIEYSDLETNEKVGIANSDPITGEYKIVLPYGKNYGFLAQKENFYPISQNFDATAITEYREIERNLILAPIEVGEKIRLNNIFFEYAKADLKSESFSELDRLVKFLNETPEIRIEIGGHTDSQGNEETNLILSEKRATEVLTYLVKKGINKERLTSKGYGKNTPVAPNDNEEGRALNRRVEFIILEK